MNKTTTGTLTIAAVAAVAVLFFAFYRAAPIEMVRPVEKAKVSFVRNVVSKWNGLWRGVAASSENVRLRREVATLAIERSEMEAVISENERLRKVLDYRERVGSEWIPAEVLSTGGGAASVRNSIRVGKGASDGVKKGAVVIVPEGLVGRVDSVTSHTADVLLVSDPSLKVACVVPSSRQIKGVVSGGDSDTLTMRYLKSGAPPAPRSKVLTSGLGGIFPAGIMVGSFISEENPVAAEDDTGDFICEGRMLPAVDLASLEDVFIRK